MRRILSGLCGLEELGECVGRGGRSSAWGGAERSGVGLGPLHRAGLAWAPRLSGSAPEIRRGVAPTRIRGLALTRLAVFGVLVASLCVMVGVLVPAAAFAGEGCSNEQVRAQQGATGMPDCRAWEMVSPLNKNGADILGIDEASSGGVVQASENGGSITYVSVGSFDDPQGAPLISQYLSTRGVDGWSTQNLMTPMNSAIYGTAGNGGPYKVFSEDLSEGLFRNGDRTPIESPSFANAPPRYQNYYLRSLTNDNTSEFQSLLTATPEESPEAFSLTFDDATPSLSQVVFSTPAALTPGAVAGAPYRENLYEWADGKLWPVNVLPNVTAGQTDPRAFFGSVTKFDERSEDHAISNDGSRLYWSTEEPEALYMREGRVKTVQVDASQNTLDPAEEGGNGVFWAASGDGSKAFFTDRRRLTNDSTADRSNENRVEEEDLYEFNADNGKLTDLTVDHNMSDVNGASVQGVLGTNEDGSYVYYVAKGILTEKVNSQGRLPLSGDDNLYVYHEGHTAFIAALSAGDNSGSVELVGVAHDWSLSLSARTERISSDGRYLLFMSEAELTGYGNRDAVSQNPDDEVYIYDADLNTLRCISCNPDGAHPIGPSSVFGATDFQVPANGPSGVYQSRELTDDGGRVFFDSFDALVPQDTNGKQDVYEWEQPGVGSCSSSSEAFNNLSGGCIYLVSGGTDPGASALVNGSSFVDASADGSDVFFITRQELVPQDTDQLVDLYDARAGGGVLAVSPPVCSGTGCQGVPSAPPIFATPSSVTFTGVGNFAAPPRPPAVKPKSRPGKCRRGFVKRHGRCVEIVKQKTRKAKKSAKGRK